MSATVGGQAGSPLLVESYLVLLMSCPLLVVHVRLAQACSVSTGMVPALVLELLLYEAGLLKEGAHMSWPSVLVLMPVEPFSSIVSSNSSRCLSRKLNVR